MVDEHGTRAIFLGTRGTDPDGSTCCAFSATRVSLTFRHAEYMDGAFTPCSKGWPVVMRINPILHWSYSDVWKLLWGGALCVASPYLAGYTSLGSTLDTAPNPALAIPEAHVQAANSGMGTLSLSDAFDCIETNDAVVRQVVALRTAHRKTEAAEDCVTVLQHSNGQWYAPAYLLTDSHRERAGRVVRAPGAAAASSTGASAAAANGGTRPSLSAAAVQALRALRSSKNNKAGIMVIGDEVLGGVVKDSNGPELIAALSGAGLTVARCVIVPDDTHAIARELSTLSQASKVVITAGGVGPTHDDVTLSAIALSFGVPLEPHPGMLQFLSLWHKCPQSDLPPGVANMANLPRGSVLVTDATIAAAAGDGQAEASPGGAAGEAPLQYPVVLVRNVFVLPGIPSLVRSKIVSLIPAFQSSAGVMHSAQLVLQADEADIAHVLALSAKLLTAQGIALGSYPVDNAHFNGVQIDPPSPPLEGAAGGADPGRTRRASVDILKPSSRTAAVRLVLSGRVPPQQLADARDALRDTLQAAVPGKWLEVEEEGPVAQAD